MIVYNVTIKIDWEVHKSWMAFMQEKHIPDLLNTGLFHGHKMFRIMEEDESDGVTYAIQYFFRNMQDYFTYKHDFSEQFQQEHKDLFDKKYVAFRTLMREV